jgi:hypothetical protein
MGRVLLAISTALALFATGDCLRTTSLSLLNADIKRYAPLIVKALFHDNVAGSKLSALSETEKPIQGDSWYWTDDNAKSLEALTLAPIFPDLAGPAAALVRFIIANSPPPFVFRRRADERLEVKSDKPEDFRVATGLMNFHGNLKQAEMRHGYRFHDDRTLDAVSYGADYVRFSQKGRVYTTDVRHDIVTAIQKEDHATTLSLTTDLKADSAVVGQATYAYRIEANKPYVALTVTVRAAKNVALTDVEVTTSLDQLDKLSDVRYSKFFGYLGSSPPVTVNAGNGPKTHVLREGPVKWWALIQNGDLGFAYAINTIVDSPDRLRSITSTDEQSGHFRHVCARYALGTVNSEQAVSVTEKKVLLAGGLYSSMGRYDDIFAHLDDFPGLDLSISYDIGAELNGVASAYAADKRRLTGRPDQQPGVYNPETRAWFDAIVDEYVAKYPIRIGGDYPYVFTRGHAFVILALDTIYAATGDVRYLNLLRRMTDVLLELRIKSGPLKDSFFCIHHSLFLDCHASAMIALARAAAATANHTYAEAARRGLNSYAINPDADTGQDVYFRQRADAKQGDSYYWVFKAGLLLRSLEGLEVLAEKRLVQLSDAEWSLIRDLQRRAVDYIARAAHLRGNLYEILTCHKAGETNSESQAWALLGLSRVEHERAEEHGK